MAHAYINTGLITVELDTGLDLSSATVSKILYKKPDGKRGEWTATVDEKMLTYEPSNTDINQAGTWQFQAYVEIGGEIGRGEIVTQTFQPHL
jgi:hypothetical protein